MDQSFFSIEDATDDEYETLRTSDWTPAVEARGFIEESWPIVEPYLDPDFQRKASRCFHPHFWELYLVTAARHAGLLLRARDERGGSDEGPDILLANGIAIEAVAAMPGIGPDAVTEGETGVARSVPDEGISLRLLNALDEKRRKLGRYRSNQTHHEDAPFVVALNAARVPSARLEMPTPRIVRALFGIGNMQVHVERETLEHIATSHARKDSIVKSSGAEVRTNAFLSSGTLAGVSAVLYSCVDSVNRPTALGADFLVVHNPYASAPIATGVLPARSEYVLRGHELVCIPGSVPNDV
jgi:hypothetical protein